ncbi:MAG: hypothetical protein ACTH7H_08170, partial [Cobetia crustatorum]
MTQGKRLLAEQGAGLEGAPFATGSTAGGSTVGIDTTADDAAIRRRQRRLGTHMGWFVTAWGVAALVVMPVLASIWL